jgi:hypothetical protein
MKNIFKTISILLIFVATGFSNAQTSKYKCMLQLTNYTGEGAYIVVSLVNPQGKYEKTLYMLGPEKKWHDTLKTWYKNGGNKTKLNGITGASVAGGDRSIFTIAIEDSYLNKGYKIRFESAVEDQKYNVSDAEIPLSTTGISEKAEGKGYIRYVKLIKA